MMIQEIIEFLEIKKPVRFEMRARSRGKQKVCAWYIPVYGNKGLKHHLIRLYYRDIAEDSRSMQTIIAHELIHAWQAEYKPKSRDHGAWFQDKSREVKKKFCIAKIYCADVDYP